MLGGNRMSASNNIYYTNPGFMYIKYVSNNGIYKWQTSDIYFGTSYFETDIGGEENSDVSSFVTIGSDYTQFNHQVCGFLIFSVWDSEVAGNVRAVGLTVKTTPDGGSLTTEFPISISNRTTIHFFGIFKRLNYIRFNTDLNPKSIAYCWLIIKL